MAFLSAAPSQVFAKRTAIGRTSCRQGVVRASATPEGETEEVKQKKVAVVNEAVDRTKRQQRRNVQSAKNFNRKGFASQTDDASQLINTEFTSKLLQELRTLENTLVDGDVTVRIAKAYGFCWGVERAVAIAYETRQHYPTETVWLTNEIIHNPLVNRRLGEMGVKFVPQEGMKKDYSGVQPGDVVVLPAFGATLGDMQYLVDLGCQIVDTTCPWVSKVWNALDKHKQRECVSIIHGKWKHEETLATASFAEKYLIVLNMKEAEYVCNYILNGGDREEFTSKFSNAMSGNFDPDRDLDAVGVANQTTMLKSETEQIAKLFERTMMKKFGPQEVNEHYVAFNTICDATQERQDAMLELLREPLDLMLVVGGYNSSNTSHLQELAEVAGVPSYWINDPACIGADNKISYLTSDGEEHVKEHFLPGGKITVGVTSGASTPDSVVQSCMENIFMVKKVNAERQPV